MRIRKYNHHETTDIINIAETHMDEYASPELEVDLTKSRMMLEQAIRELHKAFQLTYILREIEQLSVKETAESLEIESATVKTRVYRARQLLRKKLGAQFNMPIGEVFQFAGNRCDRIVAGVMRRIAEQ